MSTVDEEVKLTQADAEAMKTQGATDLKESNKMYDDMVAKNEASKNEALGLLSDNQARQEKIAKEQTDFAIEKIEQEREWAKKDYTKEQSGAYVDWQKQSNQYGVKAEQKASMGMTGTGYSESSQVSMYNQYQNRIAVARESYLRADQEFTNAITEAKLQNNALLAQIAAETLKQKLEITLTYAQQNNTLLQNKATAAMQIKAQTHANYMDVLGQINQQEALEETERHNKAVEKAQADAHALDVEKWNWQKNEAARAAVAKTTAAANAAFKAASKLSINKNKGHTVSDSDKKTIKAEPTSNNKPKTNVHNTFKTYDEAVEYMTSKGVSNEKASSVMTRSEWQSRKNRGSTSAHVKNYSTYEAYLKDYVDYATGK